MKFLYLPGSPHLAFQWGFIHLAEVAAMRPRKRDDAMLFPEENEDAGALPVRLRDASAVTAELLSDVIATVCRRFPSLGQPEKTTRIERLMASSAWTDAVLALIALELPQWQVRRIAYDEGEWHCALSRQRELPDWLDQSIEAHHPDLPLAILSAFVDARLAAARSGRSSVPAVPYDANASYAPLCCDNFT
jgi:hypothetical protein